MKPCTSIHRFHYIHNPSIYAVQIASYRTTAGIQLHRFTFCLAFVCFARLPACLPASPVQCASARVRHNIGPLSLGIDGRLDMMLIAWSGLFHGIVSLALHPLYKDFAFCRNCFGVESQATTNNFIYAFMMRTESFDVADAVCCYVSAESRVQRQPTTTVPTLPSAIKWETI